MPDIVVSSGVTFAEFPDCGSLWVIRGGFFYDGFVTPVGNDTDRVIVSINSLDGYVE